MTPSMLNCTQILEGMSEKIRMGIEAAQTDLSKEKEKKQQEEVKPFCSALGSNCLTVLCCVCHSVPAGAVEICAHRGVSIELVLPTHTHHTRGTHIQPFLRFVGCPVESKLQHAGFNPLPPSIDCARGFGAVLAKCPCSSCSPAGKVQTTTSTYKYKMQVEEATAPQELVQDLQNKENGVEEEKEEEKKEEKKEGETSDPPAEQSASQDTTGEEKQKEAEEATES